jgi:hypothetical protein
MAFRTDTTFSKITAQTFRPVFIQNIAFTTSAAVTGIQPWTTDVGPGAAQVALAGPYGPKLELLILQPDADVSVRLIGAGTASSTQTFTFAVSSGVCTATIGGIAVSVTATGTNATDAQALCTAINSHYILRYFVLATFAAGVVTITTFNKGVFNFVTTTATGTNFTAGGATMTGGTSAAAGTTATNAIKIPANSVFPMYTFKGDLQLDVKGVSASGNLVVFAGF